MIAIEHVSKRYGDKFAVHDASFTIQKGEILGFLGRNGAGKTTTMNIITGYISATSGTVKLDGYDILADPREVKRRIGYLPEMPPLYPDMTVDEYLRFVCAIKDVKRKMVSSHLDDITELIGLTEVRRRLIKHLSKGYRQRVGMAQALVGNPDVVILDEPTVGLDPKQIIEIRRLIRQLGEDHTIVLSSHILHEIADVCERVVIINQGRIVAEDSLENLTRSAREARKTRLRIEGEESRIFDALRELEGVRKVEKHGSRETGTWDFVVETDENSDIRRPLFSRMAALGCPILMEKPMDLELEDVFLQLTEERGEEDAHAGHLEA